MDRLCVESFTRFILEKKRLDLDSQSVDFVMKSWKIRMAMEKLWYITKLAKCDGIV